MVTKEDGNALLFEYCALALLGSTLYPLLEIIWRGYTHWSMAVTGGMIFVLFNMYRRARASRPLFIKCIAGGLIITAAEFAVGCVVNLIFQWRVWDYSEAPFNIMGQVCLPFTLLWCVLSVPLNYLCVFMDRLIYIIFRSRPTR